jgi:hypothetical protein
MGTTPSTTPTVSTNTDSIPSRIPSETNETARVLYVLKRNLHTTTLDASLRIHRFIYTSSSRNSSNGATHATEREFPSSANCWVWVMFFGNEKFGGKEWMFATSRGVKYRARGGSGLGTGIAPVVSPVDKSGVSPGLTPVHKSVASPGLAPVVSSPVDKSVASQSPKSQS